MARCGPFRRASTLAEVVIAIGLMGGLLLVLAAMAVQSQRGGRHLRARVEARSIAESLLEQQMGLDIKSLPATPRALPMGQLRDGTPYQATLESFSLDTSSGPAQGLTDGDIRGIRVQLTWNDNLGTQRVTCESYLARVPQ